MTTNWLLIDVNNVVWRSHHAMPVDMAGGATFGFLRDVVFLMKLLRADQVAFCFDGGNGARRKILPTYKVRDDSADEEKAKQRANVNGAIAELRDDVLDDIGFRNVFFQEDREADDVIASCVNANASPVVFKPDSPYYEDADITIVSSDKDLYQCLRPHVSIWNYKRRIRCSDFVNEYNIFPHNWAEVKAISGCKSDRVPGVGGVGELTAVRCVAGTLKKDSAFARKIRGGKKIVERNLKLVTIPFPKTRQFLLREDNVSSRDWDRVVKELGMKSLVGQFPPNERVRPTAKLVR